MNIGIGFLYRTNFFSYSFLGPEIGSQRTAVHGWAMVSILVGAIVVVAWLRRQFGPNKQDGKLIVLLTMLTFIIHIPPLSLWAMAGLMGDASAGLIGAGIHGIVVLLCIRMALVRTKRGENDERQKQVDSRA